VVVIGNLARPVASLGYCRIAADQPLMTAGNTFYPFDLSVFKVQKSSK
jgi:hypothetical protein